MLSSRESRFAWGRQDRAPNAPFFRTVARKWRPPLRKRAPDPIAELKKSANPQPTRPVWSPWLWVE